jgi:hypothetical protein
MAKLNTALLPVPSQSEDLQFSDVEETAIDSSETINEEFLNDDIFGDEDDEDDETEESESNEIESSEPTEAAPAQEAIDPVPKPEVDLTPEQLPAPVVVANPETQVVEIVWDEEAERRKDETAFFERLKELNVNIEHAKETLNEAKEEAKLAKDTLNVAVAQLQNFASKGVQYRKKPVLKPAVDPAKQAAKSEPTNANTNDPKPEQIPESEWRSWETTTILEGIEGLGSKKRDALIEHFPTFGKLMDARTESTKEHVSFHSLLPKGIGESIGTELINRMDAKIVPGM